jgi:hypothetical protein
VTKGSSSLVETCKADTWHFGRSSALSTDIADSHLEQTNHHFNFQNVS